MKSNSNLFIFQDLEVDKVHSFDIESNGKVCVNGVMFTDGFISRIEFVKHSFEDMKESLFIHTYMGNVRLSSVVVYEDYVLDIDNRHSAYYWIRKAESYDY